ncbi:glycoside hydrolase family 16 protein [Andreprevotia chitinilytica]|uniref:glycoside hydrolase family 16 protein n=1 Tax=Andreprevotia chitinilytica TaxID=396808 RepID=UPI000691447B|nr:glycoside hydrolase family 16 protein [Andreprevotia chitinilytica]
MRRLALALAPLCLTLAACQKTPSPASAAAAPKAELFDDFSYAKPDDLAAHGWIVRTEAGWPGPSGGTWGKERITFVDDPAQPGNRLLRMNAETDGNTTKQAQLCHARKYLAGTYAARVRFTDAPVSGPAGDKVVETFYTISPLLKSMDPDYSEIDFEYLPAGGWGVAGSTLFKTSWETAQIEPTFIARNEHHMESGSQAGWHTLVVQVANDETVYFLDGKETGRHGKRSYPRVPMSINFNLWFIADGIMQGQPQRRWEEDVDWVYHAAKTVLSPQEVDARIAALRESKTGFVDTVPAATPALPSLCNM